MPVGPLQANCYLVWDESAGPAQSIPGESPSGWRILAREGLALEAIWSPTAISTTSKESADWRGDRGHGVLLSEVAPVLTGAEGCSATGYPVPSARVGSDAW